MKVVVTGATGNVGTSVVEALAEGEEIGPPLESVDPVGRLDELRTAVGERQWTQSPEEKLVKHLADVHAIAEQALTQMRRAPKIAGDDRLAEIFEDHLSETEEQERRVCERLEAHGGGPSTLEDVAGETGGIGMVVFAASQPDTPGKLAAHAFSYEHMEIAAYELLRRTAEEAGDEATAAMARQIVEEEQQMADRLAAGFDAAVAASLNGSGEAGLSSQLDRCLADAHAIEKQGLQLLETAPKIIEDAELKQFFGEHLRESEEHEQLIRERLEARGAKSSKAKDATLRLGGLQVGAFFAAQPDTAAKLTDFAYAYEHLEIAAYELLERVARRAGDKKVLGVAERILAEERAAAGKLASRWDRASAAANS